MHHPEESLRIDGDLEARLLLRPLGSVADAPPTLSFDRCRAIDLPWHDLADVANTSEADAQKNAAETIRKHFEASWGFDTGFTDSKDFLAVWAVNMIVGPHGTTDVAEPEPDGDPVPLAFLPLNPSEGEPQTYDSGVFVRHGSGRVYRLLADEPLHIQDFRTWNKYRAGWEPVRGIELVRKQSGESDDSDGDPLRTTVESIDLRAPFIESRYRELMAERTMAKRLLQASTDLFDSGIKLESTMTNPARIEDLSQPLTRATVKLDQIDRELRTLVRKASKMGYVLYVQPDPVPNPKAAEPQQPPTIVEPAPDIETKLDEHGNPVETATALYGVLYRRSTQTRTYTPVTTTEQWIGYLFGFRRAPQVAPVSYETQVHVRVDTTREPHVERVAALRGMQQTVHVCELRGDNYITENGTPIELVMAECSLHEEVRLRTVVFIPTYDYRLTGERVLTGYVVFHRPETAAAPSAFPELSAVETLTYRTAWKQTEIGEVVKSINLAPGERREITVSRSYEREVIESRTSNSVFDLGSTETSDLATELERTARTESNLVDNASASATASASGSGMGMTASVSGTASASRQKSINTVGNDIAKAAQKAARTVNEQRKEEVSSTTSSRTTIATSDVSISTVENINQGRTLNLMFYRLYNRFAGELLLENLALRVRSGFEVIAGSGIYVTRTYPIGDLDRVVRDLAATPLPLELTEHREWELKLRILQEVAELVQADYRPLPQISEASGGAAAFGRGSMASASAGDHGADGADAFLGILGRLRNLKLFIPTPDTELAPTAADKVALIADTAAAATGAAEQHAPDDADNTKELYLELVADLAANLAPLEHNGRLVHSSEILVAAPGFYLDAHVGSTPSTEPYSERMREAELAMRYADVDRVESEAARNNALATSMTVAELTATTNAIVDAQLDDNVLVLVLAQPLEPGEWALTANDLPVPGRTLVETRRRIVTHRFSSGAIPRWAAEGDFSVLRLVGAGAEAPIRVSETLTWPPSWSDGR